MEGIRGILERKEMRRAIEMIISLCKIIKNNVILILCFMICISSQVFVTKGVI